MDLSILIVNWNTRDLLRECLYSVFDKWSHINPEVIVVDNASIDDSVDMVRTEFPQVLLIANEENLGFVKANNQAVEKAAGRYLLLLNSDTRVLNDEVSKVIAYMDAHPDVGIVTGKVLNKDGSFQRPFRRRPKMLGALMRHTFRLVLGFNTPFHKRFRMEDVGPDRERDVDWVIGCYIYVKRALIENNIVFDDEIFMYYEDTLLCYNCWERGYKVQYIPLAPITHYGGESTKQVPSFTAWNSYKSSVVYFKKTNGKYTAQVYSIAVIWIWKSLSFVLNLFSYVLDAKFRYKSNYFHELIALSKSNNKEHA